MMPLVPSDDLSGHGGAVLHGVEFQVDFLFAAREERPCTEGGRHPVTSVSPTSEASFGRFSRLMLGCRLLRGAFFGRPDGEGQGYSDATWMRRWPPPWIPASMGPPAAGLERRSYRMHLPKKGAPDWVRHLVGRSSSGPQDTPNACRECEAQSMKQRRRARTGTK